MAVNIDKENGPEQPSGRKAGLAVELGVNMAVGVAVLGLGGYYLDCRRGGGYVFTLCGMILGLLYCAYETWRTVRMIQQRDDRSGHDRPDNSRPGSK